MKITEIVCQVLRCESVVAKTASCQDVVLVRVRTDDGLEGIGEADSSPEVVKAIIDAPFSHNIACGLRQILVGENPLETERLWQKMYRRTMYFGRTSVTVSAMAAVADISPLAMVRSVMSEVVMVSSRISAVATALVAMSVATILFENASLE